MEKIPRIKGAREYHRWKNGGKLSRMESMLANCYVCNGEEESGVDCGGKNSCPMYPYFTHKSRVKGKKRVKANES